MRVEDVAARSYPGGHVHHLQADRAQSSSSFSFSSNIRQLRLGDIIDGSRFSWKGGGGGFYYLYLLFILLLSLLYGRLWVMLKIYILPWLVVWKLVILWFPPPAGSIVQQPAWWEGGRYWCRHSAEPPPSGPTPARRGRVPSCSEYKPACSESIHEIQIECSLLTAQVRLQGVEIENIV